MGSRRWVWTLLPLLWLGCATGVKGLEVPQEEALYDAPLEELWPSVRQFFTDHRMPFREDKGSYVLQTEWREEFGGSRVAGFWHRYLVLGKRETPTRGKLWIIRVTRSANRTLAPSGEELEWGSSRTLFAGADEGAAPGERAVGNMSIEDMADFQDAARGDNAVLSGSAQGARDLVMEWRVFRAVAPGLARREPSSPEAPRVARVPEARTAPAALVECGQPIIGLPAQARPGGVLLLGELHGTREVPRFVAQGACQTASLGQPVTVGLELPVENQERVTRFLRSAGGEEDWLKLMEAPFWRNPYPDGRGSEAMANLLDQLRQLRAQGLDVDAFVFDHPGAQGQAKEDLLADTVLAWVRRTPGRFFVVVSGNIHPRTTPGLPWDRDYQPMGLKLSRQWPGVVALDVAYNTGSAWICSVTGETKQGLECGVRPARGKDNGDRFFVHLFDRPNPEGYHGVFYVGAVTASLPAVHRGLGRPGSRDNSLHPSESEETPLASRE